MMANDPHNIWLKSRNLIKTIGSRVHICIDKLTSTLVIFLLESRICIRLLAFIFEVNKPLYISYITSFAWPALGYIAREFPEHILTILLHRRKYFSLSSQFGHNAHLSTNLGDILRAVSLL